MAAVRVDHGLGTPTAEGVTARLGTVETIVQSDM